MPNSPTVRAGRARRVRAALGLPALAAVAGSLLAVPMAPAAGADEPKTPYPEASTTVPGGGADAVAAGAKDAPRDATAAPRAVADYLDPGVPNPPEPQRVDRPDVPGLPGGVSLDRVEWLGSHRVALFINSAAMPGAPVQVQLLLPRDWHANRDRTFPELWALDGLRAAPQENGWTIATDIERYFADKNVLVVLPVGGQSSFYTDWERESNGVHYMWESFLTRELIPVLRNRFRSDDHRAVTGLSMGGTAAMNLAERHPELFDAVASYSGYLDTSSPGMPGAIAYAQRSVGGFDAEAMWGPLGSAEWREHDPKLHVDKLKGKTVYVSSGNGRDDFGSPDSRATGPGTPVGSGLEALSRMTTRTFVGRAERAGVPVVANFRQAGVHSWPYWQFEMTQAWPHLADGLGIPEEDRGALCSPVGAIADLLGTVDVGPCRNNEYEVAGGRGRAEDFERGTAYWSPETGARMLYGRINARYADMGGPGGELGFPVTGELPAPDGRGRMAHFEHGSIYWTPETGAVPMPKAVMDAWGGDGYETGRLGYPVSPVEGVPGGRLQRFEHGVIAGEGEGPMHRVLGAIGEAWNAAGGPQSPAGLPTGDEEAVPGGVIQRFRNGVYYFTPETGARFIRNGPIMDAWGARGFEQGELGWPVADQAEDHAEFQHGVLRIVDGEVREER